MLIATTYIRQVSQWSGISDSEISEIYKRKLGDTKFKHHGAASSMMSNNKDPYRNFRDVPDFSKVNGKNVYSSYLSSSSVVRSLAFMRKFVGI